MTECNKSNKMAVKHGRRSRKKGIEGQMEKRIGIGIAVIVASWEVIHLRQISIQFQINDNYFEFVFTLKFGDHLKVGP